MAQIKKLEGSREKVGPYSVFTWRAATAQPASVHYVGSPPCQDGAQLVDAACMQTVLSGFRALAQKRHHGQQQLCCSWWGLRLFALSICESEKAYSMPGNLGEMIRLCSKQVARLKMQLISAWHTTERASAIDAIAACNKRTWGTTHSPHFPLPCRSSLKNHRNKGNSERRMANPEVKTQVREYGARAAGVREARAAAAAASGGTEELEAEVQALFDEMQTQRQILDKCAHSRFVNCTRQGCDLRRASPSTGCSRSARRWTSASRCPCLSKFESQLSKHDKASRITSSALNISLFNEMQGSA